MLEPFFAVLVLRAVSTTESCDCALLRFAGGFGRGLSLSFVVRSREIRRKDEGTYTAVEDVDLAVRDLDCCFCFSGIAFGSFDLVSDQEEVEVGEDGGETNGFVAITARSVDVTGPDNINNHHCIYLIIWKIQ